MFSINIFEINLAIETLSNQDKHRNRNFRAAYIALLWLKFLRAMWRLIKVRSPCMAYGVGIIMVRSTDLTNI
jgi:hypothetical protein